MARVSQFELAHHWEYDAEKLVWTFYLRPGLTLSRWPAYDGKQLVSAVFSLATLVFYQTEQPMLFPVYSEQPKKDQLPID